MNLGGLEAGDGASLIASGVDVNFLNQVTIGSVDGSNGLAVVNDHLAPGVLIGIGNTFLDVFITEINSTSGISAELLEDAEDGG